MVFDSSHLNAFSDFSMDRNPLHMECSYAQTTNFGSQVMFGVGCVFAALGNSPLETSFKIINAKIKFKKPILLNEEYTLDVFAEGDSLLRAQFSRESVSYCEFIFKINKSESGFSNTPTATKLSSFGPKISLLEYKQLTFLAWTSFYVGMKNPGPQALYTQLNFSIKENASLETVITSEIYHEIFGAVDIKGEALGEIAFHIKALKRPERAKTTIQEYKNHLNDNINFSGYTFFISGVSRGLGLAISQLLLFHKAQVIGTYRSNRKEMAQVVEELKSEGLNFHRLIEIDLSAESSPDFLSSELKGVQIDFVINNAISSIKHISINEFNGKNFSHEFSKLFSISTNSFFGLKNNFRNKTFWFNISTSYIDKYQEGFSHYVTAKQAIETMMECFAVECKHLHVYHLRLPKMLTDQTNVTALDKTLSPPLVFARNILYTINNIKNGNTVINSKIITIGEAK
jgi:hypothetical protein